MAHSYVMDTLTWSGEQGIITRAGERERGRYKKIDWKRKRKTWEGQRGGDKVEGTREI